MNSAAININSRYYLSPMESNRKAFNVLDRARELQFLPAIIFCNGTEQECREWVLRNCEEPGEHTKGPWEIDTEMGTPWNVTACNGNVNIALVLAVSAEDRRNMAPIRAANAHLLKTAPALLALLEQYHRSMPTKDSGKLICEARGWLIQE